IIMPGSGINENNVADLVHFTGAIEIHSSAKTGVKSKMTYKNEPIAMGNDYSDGYNIDVTDVDRVKNILKNANSTC
ncbi:MAG: copper homeostasis protein CutC, partial [Mucilaginibacter sp.]|nr:copper homeostasis protein CutC [Mucilaginibacter sp.]